MYFASFMLVGVQYMIGDVFGKSITDFEGNEVRNSILDIIDTGTFNTNVSTSLDADQTTTLVDVWVGSATIGWDFISLLTGTYIFTLLHIFGVPTIIIAGIVAVYGVLLIRAFIGIIRGS